jgi:parvulin-like peptidyl-prolyl isomerase
MRKEEAIKPLILMGVFITALAGFLLSLDSRTLASQTEGLTGHAAGAKQEAPDNRVKQGRLDNKAPDSGGAKIAGPEIIARVNGEPVTRTELLRMLDDPLTKRRIQKGLGVQGPDDKELEHLVVQELIHRRLLLQEAGRRNLTVTEEEFEQALSTLRRRFGHLKTFGMWMQERGFDDNSLFDAIRTEMLASRVRMALVEGVRFTEEQVLEYYETHKEDTTIGHEVRLRMIVVKDKAAAEEVLAALRKGEKFSHLARKLSLGIRAAQGGDTGWINARTLPLWLQGPVATLKDGDVVGPIQKGSDEFLIIGLEGRRPIHARNLDEARPEIERRLMLSKQQEVVQAWLKEQKQKSKIELLIQPERFTNSEVHGQTSKGGNGK